MEFTLNLPPNASCNPKQLCWETVTVGCRILLVKLEKSRSKV